MRVRLLEAGKRAWEGADQSGPEWPDAKRAVVEIATRLLGGRGPDADEVIAKLDFRLARGSGCPLSTIGVSLSIHRSFGTSGEDSRSRVLPFVRGGGAAPIINLTLEMEVDDPISDHFVRGLEKKGVVTVDGEGRRQRVQLRRKRRRAHRLAL